MGLFQALILGLVQGLTEFLPISSSGHLTLVPFLFGWDEPTLAFIVAVHLGTLASVAYIFREQVATLIRTARSPKSASEQDRVLLRLVVVGTVPAAAMGVLFNDAISRSFERPVLVSLLLGVTGYLLMSTETVVEEHEGPPRDDKEMRTSDGVVVGIAQAVAILPGISRSGSTVAAGMRAGLSRSTAARFSFLLSIPIILGAAMVEVPDMLKEGSAHLGDFTVGFLASAASGFVAVKWFIRLIQRRGLRPFGVYCIFAMVAGLLTALARG